MRDKPGLVRRVKGNVDWFKIRRHGGRGKLRGKGVAGAG